MPTASDVMTSDVETIGPDATVADVLTRLSRAEFDGFPVVDDDDRVVGIVTQTDLIDIFQPSRRTFWIPIGLPPFTEVVDYGFDLSWEELDVDIDMTRNARKPISTVMTEDVITVGPDASLDELLAVLSNPDRDVNRVPVVDEENRVLGIVARQDLLLALREERGVVGPTE